MVTPSRIGLELSVTVVFDPAVSGVGAVVNPAPKAGVIEDVLSNVTEAKPKKI
jgi:hypothetical protein